jgi:hypothetical protein
MSIIRPSLDDLREFHGQRIARHHARRALNLRIFSQSLRPARMRVSDQSPSGAVKVNHHDTVSAACAKIAKALTQLFVGRVICIKLQRRAVGESNDKPIRDLWRLALEIAIGAKIEGKNAVKLPAEGGEVLQNGAAAFRGCIGAEGAENTVQDHGSMSGW